MTAFSPALLHVVTARANPLGWRKPQDNWNRFAQHMLDSGVNLTVCECAEGQTPFACTNPPMSDPSHASRFLHVGVRAKTRGWSKENLINLAVQRRPEFEYIAWIDADVLFRQPNWAADTVRALQHYDVIQPWQTCYDLGPNDQHIAAHTSFAHQMFFKKPLAPDSWKEPYWQGDGGKNIYPHCLLGDSLVVPGGRILAASTRPFKGNVVVIRTASGKELTCTPNHPVLVDGAWVRADLLNVGDYVFSHVRGNGVIGEPDKQHVPARIEDVVRAFSERAGADRFAHLLPDDLDNNAADCKVAQVWADRFLPHEVNAHAGQQGRNLILGDVAMQAEAFDGGRAHDLLGKGFRFPAAPDRSTLMSAFAAELGGGLVEHTSADGGADFDSPFGANFVPGAFASRRTHGSAGNGGGMSAPGLRIDTIANDAPGMIDVHADNPGALRSALATQIERDQIVFVGRRVFDGHVYDLKTERGYIIADGVLTHNSGYAWAITRQAYNWVGGLFEVGGMGSGDHHQALGLAGLAHKSLPPGPNPEYCREVMRWGERAVRHINYNVGYLPGTIEHMFHGRKSDRGYLSRWGMFVQHGFNPHEDLKRNSFGVFEFATNKPLLRRDFDLYLYSRNEDINAM